MKQSVVIKRSTNPKKKLMAVFENPKKTIHFGSAGMTDFTLSKETDRKKRYLARHRKNENWNDPRTAGALSRWILWNLPTRQASISDFKRRFNLS
tara:strand:- start:776 stop:1060 length:285 start_codon:yes stop_codon:yes gene_type:complete